ncbi:type II secretion system F family protein [Archaeoglobus veneficus]|uniref:Type II secretion system F domain protein n=1 Tax=Archaeoglobus veneficus (strain DSM 11195 / SNP6) TaxID=693661 RepID=F2KN44_ARCVS|nr:type II secretion system F family protein [Archaeoglobus veneficus]AEA46145.1 Type II secretion system F domain protein [Archaeoglobus veneficus SNP6]
MKLLRKNEADVYVKTFGIYAPPALVRYFRKRYRANRERYHDLEKCLRSSRFPVTVPKYLAVATFYPLLLAPFYFAMGYAIGVPISLYFGFEGLNWIIAALLTAVLTIATRYLILVYPKLYASHRRKQIEVVFPHVVNMMLGMSRGGISVLEMCRVIAEEVSVTGEVGKEFAVIVNGVEMFHKDLISAMKYVASTTPSQRFADFLDDFVSVIEGSGRLSEFLDFKSKHLMDEREKYQDLFLNSLGILAEVYVAALVVAPLFMLIIFVVMGMLGSTTMHLMQLLIYLYMPIGGLAFIWLLSSMMREQEIKWTGERIRRSRLIPRVTKNGRKPGFTYPSPLKRYYLRVSRAIKMLIGDLGIFIYRPEYSFYFTLPIFGLMLPFIYTWEPETIFVTFLLVTVTPYAILVEIRNRRVRKIEEHIPDFLKQLASLNESGLNIVSAIRILSTSNLGVLTSEIIKIRKDLEWGMLLSDALKRFERRIGSMTVTKVTSILLRAMEAAGTIKDALFTAATDAQLYLELKKRVRNEMFVYIVVIYMTFGVFLFTIFVLSNNFMQIFSKMSVPANAYAQFRIPDIEALSKLFYHTSLINGTVSGLIAGLMGEGELRAGLKHALVLVLVTFIVFNYFVGV